MAIQYLDSNLLIFARIIAVLPVFITVINYKWYRFNIHLKNGTFFSKRVPHGKKPDYIIALGKIQRECLYYNNAHLKTA